MTWAQITLSPQPLSDNPTVAAKTLAGVTDQSDAAVLTLETVLKQVQDNHPKLAGADIERRIAGAKLLEKQGAFDPQISLESDFLRYNDFSKKGKVSETFDNDLSLAWLSRSGLKLSTGARYNTGSVKPPLYPTGGTGEYFMGLKMPLLRGFRINDKVAAERQAALGVPQADATYGQTRLLVLQDAANAYWAWAVAAQKVTVAKSLLQLAEFRSQATQHRVTEGDLPAIDGTEAKQEVFRRQGLLTKADRDLQKAAFKLSRYLWDSPSTPSPLPILAQAPQRIAPPATWPDEDWMAGRAQAVEARPELKVLALQKEITTIDLDLAKNLRLPVLDAFAQPGLDTGSKSVGLTLKAGVALVVPLRQRTAKGQMAAARFKLDKLALDQRLLLQNVLLEVDDAVSAIQAAYGQYQAADNEWAMAKQMEQGERDRYEFGDSTLFLVNQRERASAEAALKVLDTVADYYQSVAAFRAASASF